MGRALDALMARESAAPTEPVSAVPDSSEFSKGLRSGMSSATGQLNSLAGLAGEVVGADDFARERYAAAAQNQAQAQAPENAARVSSFRDINGLRDAYDYGSGMLAQSAPVLGASLATIAATRGKVNPLVAGTLGATPFTTGGVVEQQQADPVAAAQPVGTRAQSAIGTGLGQAALMNAVPVAMGGKLFAPAAAEVAGGMGLRVARNMGEAVIGNAAAGVGSEALGQSAATTMNPNRDTSQDNERMLEAGVGGAVVGLPFAGLGIAGDSMRARAPGKRAPGAPTEGAPAAEAPVATPEGPAPVPGAEAPAQRSIAERAKELFQPVDRTPQRIAEGAETFDPAVMDGATPERQAQILAESDAARTEQVSGWAQRLMEGGKLDEAQRAQLAEAATDFTDRGKQAVVAGLKVAQEAGEKAVNAVGEFASAMKDRYPDQKPADGVKLSAIPAGADAAITEVIAPTLAASHPELVKNPTAMKAMAGSMRRLIDGVQRTGEIDGDTATQLRNWFGDDAPAVMADLQQRIMPDAKPDVTERYYSALSDLGGKLKKETSLEKIVSDAAPKGSQGNDIKGVVKFLKDYVREEQPINKSKAQIEFDNQRIEGELRKHFGDKTETVLKAFRKEALDSQPDVVRAPTDGAASKSAQDEGGFADNGQSDGLTEGMTERQFFGGGKDKAKPEFMLAEQAHRQQYGNEDSQAARVLRKTQSENPDQNVSTITARAYAKENGLTTAELMERTNGKPDDYVMVKSEGMKREGLTWKDIDAAKLDTHRYPDSPSRIQTDEGTILDGKKLMNMFASHEKLPFTDADAANPMSRLRRQMTEAIASVSDHLGEALDVSPDTVVARRGGKDVTWGEVQKQGTAKGTTVDETGATLLRQREAAVKAERSATGQDKAKAAAEIERIDGELDRAVQRANDPADVLPDTPGARPDAVRTRDSAAEARKSVNALAKQLGAARKMIQEEAARVGPRGDSHVELRRQVTEMGDMIERMRTDGADAATLKHWEQREQALRTVADKVGTDGRRPLTPKERGAMKDYLAAEKKMDAAQTRLEAGRMTEREADMEARSMRDVPLDRNVHEAEAAYGDKLGDRFAASEKQDADGNPMHAKNFEDRNADGSLPATVRGAIQSKISVLENMKADNGAKNKIAWNVGQKARDLFGKIDVMKVQDQGDFASIGKDRSVSSIASTINELYAKYKDVAPAKKDNAFTERVLGKGDLAPVIDSIKKSDDVRNLQRAVDSLADVVQPAARADEGLTEAKKEFKHFDPEENSSDAEFGPFSGAKQSKDGLWLSSDGKYTAVGAGRYGYQTVPVEAARFVMKHGIGATHLNMHAIEAFDLASRGLDPAAARPDAIKAIDKDFRRERDEFIPVIDDMIKAAREVQKASPAYRAREVLNAANERLSKIMEKDTDGSVRYSVQLDPAVREAAAAASVKARSDYLDSLRKNFAPDMRIHIVEDATLPAGGQVRQHSDGHFEVRINPAGNYFQHADVISHEFGHALQTHIFDTAPESVKSKIRGEYDALVQKYKTDGALTAKDFARDFLGASTLVDAVKSGTKESANSLISRMESAGETRGESNYAFSFDEYFANQFAKYMSSGAESAPVETRGFWQRAFRTMMKFYNDIVKQTTPGVEFKAWVDSLAVGSRDIDPEVREFIHGVRHGEYDIGAILDSAKKAEPDELSQMRDMRDDLASLRNPNENITKLMNGLTKIIGEDAKFNMQRADPANTNTSKVKADVRAHIDTVLGKTVDTEFAKMLHEGEFITDKSRVPKGMAEDAIRISVHSLDPMSTAYHESMHGFMKKLRSDKLIDGAAPLFKAADSFRVKEQLERLLAKEPEALQQVRSNLEERAAYMYQFWAAGKLDLPTKPTTVLGKMAEFFRKVLGTWSNDQRAVNIMEYFQSGEYGKNMADRSAVASALAEGTNSRLEAFKGMAAPLARLGNIVASTGDARMRSTLIPALGEIADNVYRPLHEKGNDPGYVPASRVKRGEFINELATSLRDMDPAVLTDALNAMQRGEKGGTMPERVAVRTVRQSLDKVFDYMKDAGVKVNDLGYGKDYFPRVWDASTVLGKEKEFRAMMKKYEDSGQFTGSVDNVIAKLARADGSDLQIETIKPGMVNTKERILGFIEGKDAEPFLEKDMYRTLNGYITQATRRAEWARRFGDDGERLHAMFDQATKEGASAKDLAMAADYLQGVDGTLGDSINPKLRRAFGNMIVYQNIRVLPLALFSSLIDPLGIAVRGGTAGEAFGAFKRGIMEIPKGFKEGAKHDSMTELAAQMGVIDSAVLMHTIGSTYSQGMVSDTGRRVNNTFFKYNLMEQYNTSMRVAGTESAINFLGRHADGKFNQHSTRWLAELGLQPNEVIVKNGRPLLSASEFEAHGYSPDRAQGAADKMSLAVNKWVDGAVLRPNAAHKPIWMNDPHYALVSHLKQFVYSFQETILKRVANEAQHGNFGPAYALASYVPFMMAADLMKGFIVGGGAQPGYKDSWDFGDYLWSGLQRAGLFGIGQFGIDVAKDVRRGGAGLGALSGPTIEQLGDAASVVAGPQQFKTFALNSLPANQLFDAATEATSTNTID